MSEFVINRGDVIRIERRPGVWASYFSTNCPIDEDYPMTVRVLQIEFVDHLIPIEAMCLDSGIIYGFDYDELIVTPITFINKPPNYMHKLEIKKILENG